MGCKMHHDESFSPLVRMWSQRSSSRPSHSIWNVKVALSCPNGPMSWRPARPKSFHLQTQKLGKHMAIISGTTVALDVVRAMVEAFGLWHQSWDFRVEVESCRSANKARGVHYFSYCSMLDPAFYAPSLHTAHAWMRTGCMFELHPWCERSISARAWVWVHSGLSVMVW